MRISACLGTTVLLLAVPFAPGLYAEDGLLTFVFGPSSQEAARQSAHAAAAAARHWVQTGGGVVEIRRAGNPDIKRIDKVPDAREMELTFIDTALAARDADPSSFLFTLDSAAQAAAMHSGARIVVAVLNSPPFSSDGERALEHLGEICQAHGVRVLVLDVGEGVKTVPNPALNALTAKTGGAWMRQAKSLETQVALAAPADEPAPVQAAAKAAEAAPAAPGAVLKSEIPVRIRFIRTSGTGSTSESITDHEADFGMTATLSNVNGVVGGGGGSMEVSYWPNDPNAPLQGLVTVESPLNALKFDIDDNAGSYLARARITATVRNVKGAAIWTGRRDVTVHGPMQKLNERREGSMFFMRSVTLVGQGPFSMEAKVEDLVGNTMGFIQTPVKVGRNARSLVATDAVAVRPFKGSVDKFEADQVLSYEGEALSPVLDPVFRAGQPVDLQIYLRLYPDIHGDPLDLSMDVMNEGRVVAHMSLPFKSGLANSAREGPTNGAGGTSNMVGGQAHEFPYLVNMKGAKFPAGDYQGIISIHQGKSVIKRVVAFKVVGDGTTPQVEVAKVTHTSAAADDAEIAAVVLPDIEPATIDSSGLKMRDEGQKQLWDAAAKSAMHYLDQLPNFRCIQETHRFTAPVKTPDQLKEADSYKDELIFEDGKERYQRIETDGVKADNAPVENKGISSRNEFGSLLRGLFDPDIAATYHWAGRSMTMGVLCQVFEFEVSKAKSNFVLHWGSMIEAAGYTGRVFIDDETGMVRRLTIQGTGLPKEFGLQSPSLSLDYGIVKIGRDDYLLPLRSMLQLRHAKAFVRNETVFRGYRKFEAESQIKYNN
jgi:nucleotide-binding universal stress UspA family protein